MGSIMSALGNYYLIPFPLSITDNIINNAMSGLLSGFMGAFIGFTIYFRQQKKSGTLIK